MNPMNYPQIYDIVKNMNVPKDQVPGLLAYLAQPKNLNQIYDEVLISPEIGTGRLPRIDNINSLANEYLSDASTRTFNASNSPLLTANAQKWMTPEAKLANAVPYQPGEIKPYSGNIDATDVENEVRYFTGQPLNVPEGSEETAKGFFSKVFNGKKFNDIFGEDKTIGKDLNIPNLGQAAKDIRQTNLFGMGKIGNLATAGMGLYQGGKALGTGTEIDNNLTDLSNLASQIKASAYNNPLYSSYLNTDEKKTLRQLQSGNKGVNGAGAAVQGAMQQLPKALGAALIGGATGGVGGALVNGLGSLANGALSGYNNALNERASKLQGLYDTLSSAENDYNSMRRPRNLNIAGLQSAAYRNYY